MKTGRARGFLSNLRTSDKIILGVVAAMLVATIALNILERCGLSLLNAPVMLFLPILALFALVGWGVYALIRRIRNNVAKIAAGGVGVLVLFGALILVFAYLSFVAYTAMPHHYRTVTDPNGGHRLAIIWRFDSDPERNEASVNERIAARLEAYPDSDPETVADDVTVAFEAYPQVLGLFYRTNADVEGQVFLAYTGNIAPLSVIESAEAEEPAEGEAAEEAQVIETPHGTMMMEWLDDNTTAHFYVQDPGVAEGGECTVRFDR